MISINDKSVKDVKLFLDKVIKNALKLEAPGLQTFLSNVDVDSLVNTILINKKPAITWNHAKILAVNGNTLMTGGINYWDLYANDGAHDICDHAVKIQGDAAVSAHRWADYFWK